MQTHFLGRGQGEQGLRGKDREGCPSFAWGKSAGAGGSQVSALGCGVSGVLHRTRPRARLVCHSCRLVGKVLGQAGGGQWRGVEGRRR